jgi:trimeric autotransporter adhesin
MGLKFRRGTTAQKSGSLAFGEPYVNTDLNTLQVGGANGDILLAAAGTSSVFVGSSVSASSWVSASSLRITGNAQIDGNLTLGGAITIGDNTSDTVNVVASLSSSLIPSVDNTFDLGSLDKYWRDLYISTGSIKMVSNGVVVSTLSNVGNGFLLDQGITARGDSSFGTSSAALTSVTGSFRVSGSASVIGALSASTITGIGNVSLYSSSVASRLAAAEAFSSSLDTTFATDASVTIISASAWGAFQSASSYSASIYTRDANQDTNITTVSASAWGAFQSASAYSASAAVIDNGQDVLIASLKTNILSASVYTTFSTSVDSRILTEKGRVDAILLAADADKDSFAEIVTLINSVDLTNDTSFASFYTASNGRLNSLESATGSYAISSSVASATAASITAISTSVAASGFAVSSSVASATAASITALSSSVKAVTDTFATSASVASATAASITSLSSSVAASGFAVSSSVASATAASITTLSSSVAASGFAVSSSVASATAASITSLSSSVKAVTDTFATSASVASATAASISTLSGSVKGVTDALSGRVTTLEAKDISVTLTGDVTGTGTITDLGNVSFATTIAANSVALSTDTTGDYVASLVQGTGVTITNNSGEGATPTISIGQAVATNSAVAFASVSATGDIVAYSGSDKRLKNNIINISDAVTKVRKLNGVTWKWNDDVNEVTKTAPTTGLIAQEVQEVLPEVVNEREDGYLGIDYSKMVGLLVEAIKEQQNQIDSLTIEIENLKKNNSL